jgi:arsenite oxidase large subunit
VNFGQGDLRTVALSLRRSLSRPDRLRLRGAANHMERVLREQGKAQVAHRFKGFDWKTEEDAFMDGYHNHEKGGEFVTYARLRAMGTNGFQEPAVGFKDGKIIGN